MWNECSDRNLFGTSTAHPARTQLQFTYVPCKCCGILPTSSSTAFSNDPPGCVAPKPVCFAIGVDVLQASSRNTDSHMLALLVSMLPTPCCDFGATKSDRPSYSPISTNTSRIASSFNICCSYSRTCVAKARVRTPSVRFGWSVGGSYARGLLGLERTTFPFSSRVCRPLGPRWPPAQRKNSQ